MKPEYFTPFFFGFLSFFVLRLWILKKGCLITLFLAWGSFVWVFFIGNLVQQSPDDEQLVFWVAFCLAFVSQFLPFIPNIGEAVLEFFQNQYYKSRTERTQTSQNQNPHENAHQRNSQNHQRSFDEERARREEEARQYRANRNGQGQQDRQKQSDTNRNNQKQKAEPPENITPAEAKRTYEQILGLMAGWTEDDLKKAYKREAQRTHPDKWIGKPESLKKIMEAEYKAVQEAYRKLK